MKLVTKAGIEMWMVIIQYDYDNDIYIYESLKEAESKYTEELNLGKIVYLTEILRTNI